jgi:hypothetical protein
VGTPVTLDASGSSDPDNHDIQTQWFFYPEAGSGVPDTAGVGRGSAGGVPRPDVAARGTPPAAGSGPAVASAIPPAPPGGRAAPVPRITISDGTSARTTVMPNTPGVAHVILAVTDSGTPRLTSYRRAILTIQPAGQ